MHRGSSMCRGTPTVAHVHSLGVRQMPTRPDQGSSCDNCLTGTTLYMLLAPRVSTNLYTNRRVSGLTCVDVPLHLLLPRMYCVYMLTRACVLNWPTGCTTGK